MIIEVGEIARRALAAPAQPGGPRIVAIDGPSGSGKTSLARDLLAELTRRRASTTLVRLDEIYPGWDGLAAGVALLAEGVLRPLADGAAGAYRRWDWTVSAWGDLVVVPPSGVVVVEGSGSGSRACAPHLSLLVWVEADDDERRHRALARDGDVYRDQWQRWAAQETALFTAEGNRERADVIVAT